MQEVTAFAKGTDSIGEEPAAGDVPALVLDLPQFCGVVDKQAAASIVAVAGGVVVATQLCLVLWVAERDMELMETVSKLAAFCVFTGTSGCIAGAQLRLIAGGADPGNKGRRGGLHQGEQGFGQGEASITRNLRVITAQQVVHQLFILR